MVGDIAVGIIIVSGPTPDLQFSDSERQKVLAEVQNGLSWYASQYPLSDITWNYDIHSVQVDAQPGTKPDKEALWRDPAMVKLGYQGNFAGVYDYVQHIRTSLNSRWTYVGYFTKYPLDWFAYATLGGPRLVMQYANDGWGPDNIDRVFAHETGHIFQAPDEYSSSNCNCGGAFGIFDKPNGNCQLCAPNGGVDCIMRTNSWAHCTWTPWHFGVEEVTWSDDALLPNPDHAYGISGSPALAVYNGKLYCVRQGRGDSGWTWYATYDGTTWSDDALLPNPDHAYGISGSPALAVYNGKLYCVRQGRDDSGWTWYATYDGTTWSDDALLPNPDHAYGISGSPALAVYNGKLYCVRQGRGDSGWTWYATYDGTTWSDDALLPNPDHAYGISGSPALAVYNGKLYCVRQGRGDSGWTWYATYDGTTWSDDALLPNPDHAYGISGSPALAVYNGKLYCVRQGRGDSGWTWCATYDGTTWSDDALLPNPDHAYGISGSPALAVYNGKLYCVRQGRDDSGWTWYATKITV